MAWYQYIIAIVLSVILGALIGLEREISGKSAGLRTNVLICLGAAVFTIVSKQMTGGSDAMTRITAQIVSGVGFIGAGAIIQDRGGISGLTTAATIWLVASVGMVCGAGHYLMAIIVTAVALVVLVGMGPLGLPIEKRIKKLRESKQSKEDHC